MKTKTELTNKEKSLLLDVLQWAINHRYRTLKHDREIMSENAVHAFLESVYQIDDLRNKFIDTLNQ